jgi:hypothetical protein
VSEQKPQKKVSKLSSGSYLNIVLSTRSQATEYSTWTKLDFIKTVRQKVVAIHGSKNVRWEDFSFHLTVVACVGASGFAVPPLFAVPDSIFHGT